MKILFIIFGSLCFGIGILGIVLPGLPSTIFFILSANFYLRSSPRLYKWLIKHPIFGKNIRAFQENKGMSWKSKLSALTIMWIMILISIFLLNDKSVFRWIIFISGLAGTLAIVRIKITDK